MTQTAPPKMLTMVVPVRNRRLLMKRLLDCIAQALRLVDFDLVVVDNGSTDGTRLEVSRWIRLNAPLYPGSTLTVIEEPRPGACAARNTGLAAVNTPYVMFFDSDDTFAAELPHRISQLAFARPTDMILWEVKRTDGQPMPPTSRAFERGHHLFHGSLATQRYAVSTALVRRAGAWNESLPVWNDLELGVRLLTLNPSWQMLGTEPMVNVLCHAESITGTRFSDRPGQRELALDAIWHTYNECGMTDMLPLVDARRLILADTYRREGSPDASRALRSVVASHRYQPATRLALTSVALVQNMLGRGGSSAALHLL